MNSTIPSVQNLLLLLLISVFIVSVNLWELSGHSQMTLEEGESIQIMETAEIQFSNICSNIKCFGKINDSPFVDMTYSNDSALYNNGQFSTRFRFEAIFDTGSCALKISTSTGKQIIGMKINQIGHFLRSTATAILEIVSYCSSHDERKCQWKIMNNLNHNELITINLMTKLEHSIIITAFMSNLGFYLRVANEQDIIHMQLVEHSNVLFSIIIFDIVVGSFALFYFFIIFLIMINMIWFNNVYVVIHNDS